MNARRVTKISVLSLAAAVTALSGILFWFPPAVTDFYRVDNIHLEEFRLALSFDRR